MISSTLGEAHDQHSSQLWQQVQERMSKLEPMSITLTLDRYIGVPIYRDPGGHPFLCARIVSQMLSCLPDHIELRTSELPRTDTWYACYIDADGCIGAVDTALLPYSYQHEPSLHNEPGSEPNSQHLILYGALSNYIIEHHTGFFWFTLIPA